MFAVILIVVIITLISFIKSEDNLRLDKDLNKELSAPNNNIGNVVMLK